MNCAAEKLRYSFATETLNACDTEPSASRKSDRPRIIMSPSPASLALPEDRSSALPGSSPWEIRRYELARPSLLGTAVRVRVRVLLEVICVLDTSAWDRRY